jgi:hypothetical protein
MRFFEFAPRRAIKTIKPMTPAQARIDAGKKRVDQARDSLRHEREAQRLQNERESQAKKLRRG